MQVEDIVKLSSKGQIVIPLRVRKQFGLEPGERLLLAVSEGGEILLRRLQHMSLEEISNRTSKIVEREKIDVDALVEEAISWARKGRKRKSM